MTEMIKSGDTISVNYTGKLEDGEVFDTSEGRSPLKFTVGAGQLIKGFDDAVVGMGTGDRKTVTIPAEDAYGLRRDDHLIDLPKASIPPEMNPEVGMQVQLSSPAGHPIPAVVADILDEVIRVDANHPLAGKPLVFDIEIAETGLEPDQSCCGDDCDSDCHSGCAGCGAHES